MAGAAAEDPGGRWAFCALGFRLSGHGSQSHFCLHKPFLFPPPPIYPPLYSRLRRQGGETWERDLQVEGEGGGGEAGARKRFRHGERRPVPELREGREARHHQGDFCLAAGSQESPSRIDLDRSSFRGFVRVCLGAVCIVCAPLLRIREIVSGSNLPGECFVQS